MENELVIMNSEISLSRRAIAILFWMIFNFFFAIEMARAESIALIYKFSSFSSRHGINRAQNLITILIPQLIQKRHECSLELVLG